MVLKVAVVLFAYHWADALKLIRPSTVGESDVQEEKNLLAKDHVDAIRDLLYYDSVIVSGLPESPILRVGFHIAATYDSTLGRGGWNQLATRAELRAEGLMDDVLVVYWDVLENYWVANSQHMHGMSKPDYLSFVIYLYTLSSTYSRNITWRAGRTDSNITSDHMRSGRPGMPQGFATSYKPEGNMSSPDYLRAFFGRMGFDEDEDVVFLMLGHSFGAARGLPYLGEFMDPGKKQCKLGCYYEYMLTEQWSIGCPTTWAGILVDAATNFDPSNHTDSFDPYSKTFVPADSFDPYSTTVGAAPSNLTDAKMWGENCSKNLAALSLYEYTNGRIFRTPADMALVNDSAFLTIIKTIVNNTFDKQAGFGPRYTKMLEMGVPEEDLYYVVSYATAVPGTQGDSKPKHS